MCTLAASRVFDAIPESVFHITAVVAVVVAELMHYQHLWYLNNDELVYTGMHLICTINLRT